MTLSMGDTYFVVMHWHVWPMVWTALALIAIGGIWKLRKR